MKNKFVYIGPVLFQIASVVRNTCCESTAVFDGTIVVDRGRVVVDETIVLLCTRDERVAILLRDDRKVVHSSFCCETTAVVVVPSLGRSYPRYVRRLISVGWTRMLKKSRAAWQSF